MNWIIVILSEMNPIMTSPLGSVLADPLEFINSCTWTVPAWRTEFEGVEHILYIYIKNPVEYRCCCFTNLLQQSKRHTANKNRLECIHINVTDFWNNNNATCALLCLIQVDAWALQTNTDFTSAETMPMVVPSLLFSFNSH